jgi:hypothetical protein
LFCPGQNEIHEIFNYQIIIFTAIESTKAQEVHNLLRVVNQKPVAMKLLTTMPLEMPLVPMILSLTITYVIVYLQLNKIV